MPEYDFTQSESFSKYPLIGVLQPTQSDTLTLLIKNGKLASAAHYLHCLEATGRNVTRLLAIAARELGLRERDNG